MYVAGLLVKNLKQATIIWVYGKMVRVSYYNNLSYLTATQSNQVTGFLTLPHRSMEPQICSARKDQGFVFRA